MTNLFNINTMRLAKEYSDSNKYSHRQVLEKLVTVSFYNNGFLPNEFDIPIVLPNNDIVADVLRDLGYPHVRDNINCFPKTTHIRITK